VQFSKEMSTYYSGKLMNQLIHIRNSETRKLSLAGIVGLQYLPVSIARLCALNLSFVKNERTYLLILNVRYFCSTKVVRILLKNLSFLVSLFLIRINWFISLPE
jgi:hypothetical protein